MTVAPRSHIGLGVVAEDWYTNDYPDEEESDREDEADLSGEFLSFYFVYLQLTRAFQMNTTNARNTMAKYPSGV